MTIHLITTCSRSKATPPGDTRFPYTETKPAAALAAWRETLSRAPVTGSTAALYCGLHSDRARAIAARHAEVGLWFLSAGLGLRHATDPAVTYEATFHDLPYPAALHWAGLTYSPPLPGRQPSLTRLMQSSPGDKYVIAASPVYLAAVEDDLVAGAAALPEADRQLIIVTSKGYQGGSVSTGSPEPCGDADRTENQYDRAEYQSCRAANRQPDRSGNSPDPGSDQLPDTMDCIRHGEKNKK